MISAILHFDVITLPFLDGDVPRHAFNAQLCEIIYQPNFSRRDIGIINFEKHFLNLIPGTMN